jgi:hypothetical protein
MPPCIPTHFHREAGSSEELCRTAPKMEVSLVVHMTRVQTSSLTIRGLLKQVSIIRKMPSCHRAVSDLLYAAMRRTVGRACLIACMEPTRASPDMRLLRRRPFPGGVLAMWRSVTAVCLDPSRPPMHLRRPGCSCGRRRIGQDTNVRSSPTGPQGMAAYSSARASVALSPARRGFPLA